jgi:hypothetical protein
MKSKKQINNIDFGGTLLTGDMSMIAEVPFQTKPKKQIKEKITFEKFSDYLDFMYFEYGLKVDEESARKIYRWFIKNKTNL